MAVGVRKIVISRKQLLTDLGTSNRRLILIAGPSCCGKSTLANAIATSLGGTVLHGDDWALPEKEILARLGHVDLEAPEAFDLAGIRNALTIMMHSGVCERPIFDFSLDAIVGSEVLRLGEGPLILEFLHATRVHFADLLSQWEGWSLFVRAPTHIRILRRIARDTQERGKSLSQVLIDLEQALSSERSYYQGYENSADVVYGEDLSSGPEYETLMQTVRRIADGDRLCEILDFISRYPSDSC